MANIGIDALKDKIDEKIVTNGAQEITAAVLNDVLQDSVDTLADGGNLDDGSVTKSKLQQNVSTDLDWAVASNSYYRNSQAGDVAAKVITTYKNMGLIGGGSLKVTFEQANTADDATLNIDGKGAKPLYYNGARVSSTNSWEANETVEIYYNNYNSGAYHAKRWMVEPVSVSQNTSTKQYNLNIGGQTALIVDAEEIIFDQSSSIPSGGTYKAFTSFPSSNVDRKAYIIVSGISSGIISFNNSSWAELIRTNFVENERTPIVIPDDAAIIVVSVDGAVQQNTPFTAKVFTGGAMSLAENNAVDIKNITCINISEAYPTGGTGGTDVYTIDGARRKVPTSLRKQGLIISYKIASDNYRIEQKSVPFNSETEWIYGLWDLINLHNVLNINEYNSHPDIYNDRKAARNAVPEFARNKGQYLLYKSTDGYHIEENIGDSWNNNDQYFKQILPPSISLLKEPTILYEEFISLPASSTNKIISGFTAVTRKTNIVIKICGISGTFTVLNSNYQRLYEQITFEDGKPFVAETYPDVSYLYIAYSSLAASTKIYMIVCSDTEDSNITALKDSIAAEYDNSYDKQWGERTTLNLASLNTSQGKLNNTGQFESNNYWRMSFDYIPVKSGSFIQTITTNWVYAIKIAFFKRERNGAYTFVSISDNNKMVFVPSGVTHARFGFYISYPNDTVLTEELLEENYVVTVKSSSTIGSPLSFDNLFEKNPVLKISDYTDWIVGVQNTYSNEKMTTELPIRVTPGHRYRLELPMDNTHINNAGWNYGETYDNLTGWKAWLSGTPLNGRNFFFDAPVNANFIRIQLSGTAGSIAPSEAENITLVDVTGCNPFESVTKMIDNWNHPNSYAQGMTISNGYIFQAFADGYIDIYDVDTLALVQSVFAPPHEGVSALHCNNLTFGEKYDVNDDFGVLYVNSDDANDPIVGIRVQLNDGVFTFTKVYEITPPEVDETLYVGNDEIIDIYNKRLVEVLYATGYGDMTMRVYEYDNLDDSAKFTLQNTFTSAKLYPLQGGMLRDELLYLCVGSGGGNKACIYVFNIISGELVWILDLRKPKFRLDTGEEMQGIALYKNQLYFSTTYGLYIYSQG